MEQLANAFYSVGLIALGFVPTLLALELSWRMAYRLGKRDKPGTASVAGGPSPRAA
ncbi:MAG TPA: hypothetical protein VF172_05150 [Nitrososphaera sp.]